jgi:hypothetical protein
MRGNFPAQVYAESPSNIPLTPQKSYPKSWNPRTTFENPPFSAHSSGVGILIFLLVRSKFLEPYNNPFWDFSNSGKSGIKRLITKYCMGI